MIEFLFGVFWLKECWLLFLLLEVILKKIEFYFMGNWMEDLFVVGKENVFSLLLFLLL